MSTVPLDPATAKARVAEAIERSERTVTLSKVDSWPSCRPMVEWIVRQLPDGGWGLLTGRMSARERREMPWQVFTQKELAEATGVSASSISSRSQTVANVVERADIDWPRLLHSTQRAEMLETKRVIAEWGSRAT